MMSREQLEAFRRMSVSERWKLLVKLMDSAWEDMTRLPPEQFARRIQILNRQHEEGNRRILERFRTLNGAPTDPARS